MDMCRAVASDIHIVRRHRPGRPKMMWKKFTESLPGVKTRGSGFHIKGLKGTPIDLCIQSAF